MRVSANIKKFCWLKILIRIFSSNFLCKQSSTFSSVCLGRRRRQLLEKLEFAIGGLVHSVLDARNWNFHFVVSKSSNSPALRMVTRQCLIQFQIKWIRTREIFFISFHTRWQAAGNLLSTFFFLSVVVVVQQLSKSSPPDSIWISCYGITDERFG